jgi:RNA polymerase sigma-70 factor (ECF subfamily)
VAEGDHDKLPVPVLLSVRQLDQADYTDRRLVERTREGQEQAFLALLNRHYGPMRRFAVLVSTVEATACEAVRRCWLAIIDENCGANSTTTFRASAYRLLLATLGVKASRAPCTDPHPVIEFDRFLPPGDRWEATWADTLPIWRHLEGPTLNAEAEARVEMALRRLPLTTRIVLVLRDVNGIPSHEVTVVTGISDADQRVLLHEGRGRIMEALAQFLQPQL